MNDLYSRIKDEDLPIEEGIMVDKIDKKGNVFELITKKGKIGTSLNQKR